MKVNIADILKITRRLPVGKAVGFALLVAKYAKGGFTPDELAELGRRLLELATDVAEKQGNDAALAFISDAGDLFAAVDLDLAKAAP